MPLIIIITIMLLEPRFKIASFVQFLFMKHNSCVLWRTVHV
jgi:hypothetical protein